MEKRIVAVAAVFAALWKGMYRTSKANSEFHFEAKLLSNAFASVLRSAAAVGRRGQVADGRRKEYPRKKYPQSLVIITTNV